MKSCRHTHTHKPSYILIPELFCTFFVLNITVRGKSCPNSTHHSSDYLSCSFSLLPSPFFSLFHTLTCLSHLPQQMRLYSIPFRSDWPSYLFLDLHAPPPFNSLPDIIPSDASPELRPWSMKHPCAHGY